MAVDYGVDLGCYLSTDPLFSSVSGIDVVRQDALHRLITDSVLGPAGDDWGYDCRRLLGLPDSRLASVQPLISEVLERDERIQTATVTVRAVRAQNGARNVYVEAVCATAAGPFDLVLDVTALTAQTIETQTS